MVLSNGVIDELLASDLVDDPSRSAAKEPLRAAVTAKRRRLQAQHASLAAFTLGSIGGFLVLSRAIRGKHANTFDRATLRTFGRARHPITNALAHGITFFGGLAGAGGVAALAVALTRRRPRLAWQVVAGALGGISAELYFKRVFKRKRPTLLRHLEEVESTSFPSGHSMAASSLYLTLAFVASRSKRLRGHRTALLTSAGALATSIGASRVYLGVHWPTDVFGGLALGTAWACIAETVFDLTGAERLERQAEAEPEASLVSA